MKKNMMKLGVIAALVMGASSMAHAASQAKIDMTGRISAQTCDISVGANQSTLALGNFAPSAFTSIGSNQVDGAPTATLAVVNCGSVAAGDAIVVTASEPALNADITTANPDLWGENDIGVGVHILARVGTAAQADFTPADAAQGLVVYTNGTGGAVNNPTTDQIVLSPRMQSYADAADIEDGTVTASLVFSADVQ